MEEDIILPLPFNPNATLDYSEYQETQIIVSSHIITKLLRIPQEIPTATIQRPNNSSIYILFNKETK